MHWCAEETMMVLSLLSTMPFIGLWATMKLDALRKKYNKKNEGAD